jgi:hypothetical protein
MSFGENAVVRVEDFYAAKNDVALLSYPVGGLADDEGIISGRTSPINSASGIAVELRNEILVLANVDGMLRYGLHSRTSGIELHLQAKDAKEGQFNVATIPIADEGRRSRVNAADINTTLGLELGSGALYPYVKQIVDIDLGQYRPRYFPGLRV